MSKRLFSTGHLLDEFADYSARCENEPETGCPPVVLEMLMTMLTQLEIIRTALCVICGILIYLVFH